MVLRIFHSLMVPFMLLVSRSYDFSSALINILDCTPSDTLGALASISHNRIQCSLSSKLLALYLLGHLANLNSTLLAPPCELPVFLQPRLHREYYRISLARDKSCSDISYSLSDVK